jgi:hypothetical protein
MKRWYREPARDPELSAALGRIEEIPRETDNDMLRGRIVAAARARLASLAAPDPRWWELVSARARVMVPLGLAAAFAALLLMPGTGEMNLSDPYALVSGSDTTLALAAFSGEAGTRLSHLIAPAGHDWLLEQAIGR